MNISSSYFEFLAFREKVLDHHGISNKECMFLRCVVANALQGRPYGARIDLTLPQAELVVNKIEDEDVYVALRDAFQAIRRQLEEIVDQRHGHRSPRNKVRYKNGEIFE